MKLYPLYPAFIKMNFLKTVRLTFFLLFFKTDFGTHVGICLNLVIIEKLKLVRLVVKKILISEGLICVFAASIVLPFQTV